MKSVVNIRLPKAAQGQEQEVFVGVNGVGYRIRRGTDVTVPLAVAEILRLSELASDANDRFLEANVDPEGRK